MQLHTLLGYSHTWAAGMYHATPFSRHTHRHPVACHGYGSVKERNAARHWPTGTPITHFWPMCNTEVLTPDNTLKGRVSKHWPTRIQTNIMTMCNTEALAQDQIFLTLVGMCTSCNKQNAQLESESHCWHPFPMASILDVVRSFVNWRIARLYTPSSRFTRTNCRYNYWPDACVCGEGVRDRVPCRTRWTTKQIAAKRHTSLIIRSDKDAHNEVTRITSSLSLACAANTSGSSLCLKTSVTPDCLLKYNNDARQNTSCSQCSLRLFPTPHGNELPLSWPYVDWKSIRCPLHGDSNFRSQLREREPKHDSHKQRDHTTTRWLLAPENHTTRWSSNPTTYRTNRAHSSDWCSATIPRIARRLKLEGARRLKSFVLILKQHLALTRGWIKENCYSDVNHQTVSASSCEVYTSNESHALEIVAERHLCLESDRLDGQKVHPRAESRTILVWFQSAVSKASKTKARQERKQRTQEHPGVLWSADGMIFERHTESLKHLESTLEHWMNYTNYDSRREKIRIRAHGETLSVLLPRLDEDCHCTSDSHMLAARQDAETSSSIDTCFSGCGESCTNVACMADMTSVCILSEAEPRSSGASRCPRFCRPLCAGTNHFQHNARVERLKPVRSNWVQVEYVQECTDWQSDTFTENSAVKLSTTVIQPVSDWKLCDQANIKQFSYSQDYRSVSSLDPDSSWPVPRTVLSFWWWRLLSLSSLGVTICPSLLWRSPPPSLSSKKKWHYWKQ